ncbi:MAG: hypothetical protein J6T67_01905 [Paludibacteraceae bacterium]|nr:hypothetical protein [Paludibacteraceae bacterium]MBR4713507.1 hypothetical protein [Paludibacteraceae bacterium]MBR5374830.1 hypothetical protein [Paludibacteraceae bacterium]
MIVYACPNISDANIRIKEVQFKSDADIIIYKCSSMGDSNSENTNWFFCDSPANAVLKVYFVSNVADAHLKVYFSNFRADAHWLNHFKEHLINKRHL